MASLFGGGDACLHAFQMVGTRNIDEGAERAGAPSLAKHGDPTVAIRTHQNKADLARTR